MKRRDVIKGAAAVGAGVLIKTGTSHAAQVDAAKKWIDNEFQPSTLSKDQQMAEMEWFISASKPYQGLQISCASKS